jgi:hypothetical protein
MSAQAIRVITRSRFLRNPPFDPQWPMGRHFAPPDGESGVVHFPLAA